MLGTHFHRCTYVGHTIPSCTYVGHTFPRLYICLPHISTAVRMLGTHHHRCTYVGHTFPQMYVCWTHISTAVLMLATHFHSCTYLATQFRTRYGRPPASFNHRSIWIMSGYLLQLYACLRYATIARCVKAHNGVFSYGRWPPKSSNCALVFQPTFQSLGKKNCSVKFLCCLRIYVSELNLEVLDRLQQNLVRTSHPSRTPGRFKFYTFLRALVKTWRSREHLSWKW